MAYRHFDLIQAQSSKASGALCGDVFGCRRDAKGTTAILCDGMGSGPRAHLAAQWYVARFLELLAEGQSFRYAFDALCRTLRASRGKDPIWAALTAIRIRPNGEATVLSHEMPPPLLLTPQGASPLVPRSENREGCLAEEVLCHLQPKEGLLFFSDGVTQSGLRASHGRGWSPEELAETVTPWMREGTSLASLPERLRRDAQRRWLPDAGDDISVGSLICREGLVVNLLTGPPADRRRDRRVVEAFLQAEGLKVVCGSTTAALVARHAGCEMNVKTSSESPHVPPEYELPGVDVASEGTVTLSQVCRLLDTDVSDWSARHAVARLTAMLQAADAVRMTVGLAVNTANEDLVYRQIGVLTRREIVQDLRRKLEAQGKAVHVEWV